MTATVVDLRLARLHKELGSQLQLKPICLAPTDCAGCGRSVSTQEHCYWSMLGGLRCTDCGPLKLSLA